MSRFFQLLFPLKIMPVKNMTEATLNMLRYSWLKRHLIILNYHPKSRLMKFCADTISPSIGAPWASRNVLPKFRGGGWGSHVNIFCSKPRKTNKCCKNYQKYNHVSMKTRYFLYQTCFPENILSERR